MSVILSWLEGASPESRLMSPLHVERALLGESCPPGELDSSGVVATSSRPTSRSESSLEACKDVLEAVILSIAFVLS